MTYFLSKGVLAAPTGSGTNSVTHCGQTITLKDGLDELWQSGRFSPRSVDDKAALQKLQRLGELGIAEVSCESESLALYRILTNSIICPAKMSVIRRPLSKIERIMNKWIRNAGLRLTTAELIFLFDRKIEIKPELLGESNRQALTETIYTTETIFDGILESKMERAETRDEAVAAILGLLHKKRIILI